MNKIQWKFNANKKLFIHENASENIFCELVAILSRGRWLKLHHIYLKQMAIELYLPRRDTIILMRIFIIGGLVWIDSSVEMV